MPERIQRQRTKGWRMPDGTVYVGRPSRWGNPFRLVPYHVAHEAGVGDVSAIMSHYYDGRLAESSPRIAVDRFRDWVAGTLRFTMVGCEPHGPLAPVSAGVFANYNSGFPAPKYPIVAHYAAPFTGADVRRELAGRDLACWCPLDQPCHADVLLELANR